MSAKSWSKPVIVVVSALDKALSLIVTWLLTVESAHLWIAAVSRSVIWRPVRCLGGAGRAS